MSKFKLSSTLHITLKEAEALIATYFKTFPKIEQVLRVLGRFAVERGYSLTLFPYNRRRTFPQWLFVKHLVQEHLTDPANGYNATLGTIERAGKNHPIQGSSGDMIKLAMWYMYKWIRDNDYVNDIRLVLNVHDQLTSICRNQEIADIWAPVMDKLMCEAAKVILPSGLVKADTQQSKFWTK